MRTILLTFLIVSLVCASAFAFWNPFSSRTTAPTFNEAELRASLAGLAPTEAEAKAIAALRAKSPIQWQVQHLQQLESKMRHAQGGASWLFSPDELARLQQEIERTKNAIANHEPPVMAEPVDDDSVQISIEHRFLSAPESLISTIIGHPAMTWSGLPVAEQFSSANNTLPGMALDSVNVQVPILVRYLEQASAYEFQKLLLSQRTAPSFTLRNGEARTVSDTTKIPFVTNVLPIEADGAISYQPFISIFDTGMAITSQVTLLQDNSYRLTNSLSITEVARVDTFRLINEGTVVESRDGRSATATASGITIQTPIFRTFSALIPNIVIPEGMSLLVAFPGATLPGHEENDPHSAFLLITPRKELGMPFSRIMPDMPEVSVELRRNLDAPARGGYSSPDAQDGEERVLYQSENQRLIQEEWERFWRLDEPFIMSIPYRTTQKIQRIHDGGEWWRGNVPMQHIQMLR